MSIKSIWISKFLKKEKDGNYFDLKQKAIKITEPY